MGNFGYARKDDSSQKTAKYGLLISEINNCFSKGDDVVYKAPEVIKNQALANYGKSVDVYSYGMVVWYMAHRGE